jgi:hypothetical protein
MRIKIAFINFSKLIKVNIGSLVWSSDSTKLAYLAEVKKASKDKSFFVAKSTQETSTNSESEQVTEIYI